MAKQGQQSSPLPKQTALPSKEEPALNTTTSFPAISQVSNLTADILTEYFKYKIAGFKQVDFANSTMNGRALHVCEAEIESLLKKGGVSSD